MGENLFGEGPWLMVLSVAAGVIILVSTLVFWASRYKRCPSDMILVVYGSGLAGQSSKCIHGGAQFIVPVIQDYAFLSLVPMTISIPLQNALSQQNIRVNVPSTFTVGISTDPAIMNNAAERLLNQSQRDIEQVAGEIIFGQLRQTIASLTIEQINQDRESFLEAIRRNVEPELNKVGLYLINVNITDITDESNYIASIGKKAASEAINRAKIDVAEQERIGAIGESNATRDRVVKVAENTAAADKGQKQADADRRIFIQQQETLASVGEAEAVRVREIKVAENDAETAKGQKKAEADKRVFIQGQESEAIKGENTAKAHIAESNAELAIRQAEAMKQAEVAKRVALAEIQKAQYQAETERLVAEEVAQKEVEKRKIEIAASAEGEKTRLEAKGMADATLLRYEAEAAGIRKVLDSKAAGYQSLVASCKGDARAAATLLLIEKIEHIVETQVEAIKNIKIDKITVWDSGGNGDGSSTSNFVSSLIKSVPPLQDIAAMAGVELPEYLGRIREDGGEASRATASPSTTKS